MNSIAELYAAVLPAVLQAIAALLGLLLLRASEAARKRWGIQIEAAHRDALHSALMSGIRAALSRGLSGTAAVASAVTYAQQSVPDAIKALAPSAEVITQIAEAKLDEARTALASPG